MTLVLRATGVHRVFGEGAGRIVALKGVDLAVQARQITALVGPPGSGKSTLVRAVGGLDRKHLAPGAGTERGDGAGAGPDPTAGGGAGAGVDQPGGLPDRG